MSNILSKLNDNTLALVLLPIMCVPLIFYNTTIAMMRVWMVNETFTHGFLILPLTIWMIWQKRSQIALIQPYPEPRVIVFLILFLIGWFVGSLVDVEVVQQFCMISMILASIWIMVGRHVFLYVLFPLMFLFFAVPFGQIFIPTLMQYTANFTVMLIKMTGIPIYQDGLTFILPTGSWSVVEECSGVRYLIASLSLGSIYAYLSYSSTKKRLIFILLSLIVPIIGNGLRAFGIVMIGHFSGMELAVGVDHIVYGWLFFGIIIFLLFYAGSFWWDTEDSIGVASVKERKVIDSRRVITPSTLSIVILVVMIPISVFSGYLENEKLKEIKSVSIQLPDYFSSWQYDADKSLNWQPIFLNPDIKVSRGYYRGGDIVQLDIAYYQIQRYRAEAVSTNNKIASPYGGKWRLISANNISKGENKFIESELRFADEKLLVWSWYRVGKYETANPYIAKALEAYNLVFERRSDASMLSIAIRFNDTKKTAREKIYGFWKDASNDITKNFEQIIEEK